MKRALAILLAAAITVLLCACGDTTYQGLTDALSSGDYQAVKTELSNLSPDYKAEQEKLSGYQQKYGTLVDALEAEDYEAAQEDLQALIPTEPEPEYTYVDITMDNYQEYFDVEIKEYWGKNAFYENEFYGYSLLLTVKEAYRDRLPHEEAVDSETRETVSMCSMLDQEIAIEVKVTHSFYNVEVDSVAKTAEKGSKRSVRITNDGEPETVTLTGLFWYNQGNSKYLSGGGYLVGSDGKPEAYAYPETWEILSISGTLPLLAE